VHAAEFCTGGGLDLERVTAAIEKSGSWPIGVAVRFVW